MNGSEIHGIISIQTSKDKGTHLYLYHAWKACSSNISVKDRIDKYAVPARIREHVYNSETNRAVAGFE